MRGEGTDDAGRPEFGICACAVRFTGAILKRRGKNRFLGDFSEFQRRVSRIGMFNSLSQCLLKMTLPGVPDFYQGNELWDFSLVDPDNRRPVDYDKAASFEKMPPRDESPDQLRDFAGSLLANMDNGLIKMYLTQKTLTIRKDNPAIFQDGRYVPLKVTGSKANHVGAFAREFEGRVAIVAVPRLCSALLGDDLSSPCNEGLWSDTEIELPEMAAVCVHNAFTGECLSISAEAHPQTLRVGRLLRDFPVALLLSAATDL